MEAVVADIVAHDDVAPLDQERHNPRQNRVGDG